MNIGIIHYHLNRGGVTQVVINHLRALNEVAGESGRIQVAILYGGRHEAWPATLLEELSELDISLRAIDGLDYDAEQDSSADSERLAKAITTELRGIGFTPRDTVLHVHNHSLGKNLATPGAVQRLALAGYPLLLHLHDFAEDFRPQNYRTQLNVIGNGDPHQLNDALYPQASHIHYAALNGRDLSVLRRAGVADNRLHLLPNPVGDFVALPPQAEARQRLAAAVDGLGPGPLVLYPVRGIRRKNVGEALIWAAVLPPGASLGMTLPPLNPVEQQGYERWKRLATELSLPCLFELGTLPMISFMDNMAAAAAILTTSVAEGFGMVFLEAWLAGRPLVGRDLPEITADFIAAGLSLDLLYPSLEVPIDWVGRDAFSAAMTEAFLGVLESFGRPAPSSLALAGEIKLLTAKGTVDFAMLSSPLQAEVIRRLVARRTDRDRLLDANPCMAAALAAVEQPSPIVIQANATAVRKHFSLPSAGHRLINLYRTVADSQRSSRIDPPPRGESILGSFLSLARLQPLRIEMS